MKSHGDGFEHRGLGKRKIVRQSMDDARRNHDKLGKRSRATVVTTRDAQHLAAIAQIDVSAQAGSAFATIHSRVESDSVAF